MVNESETEVDWRNASVYVQKVLVIYRSTCGMVDESAKYVESLREPAERPAKNYTKKYKWPH